MRHYPKDPALRARGRGEALLSSGRGKESDPSRAPSTETLSAPAWTRGRGRGTRAHSATSTSTPGDYITDEEDDALQPKVKSVVIKPLMTRKQPYTRGRGRGAWRGPRGGRRGRGNGRGGYNVHINPSFVRQRENPFQ